jgi:hypothetical protein
LVGETVAAGYTYQGQMLRLALVSIETPHSDAAVNEVRQRREAVGNITENSPKPDSL